MRFSLLKRDYFTVDVYEPVLDDGEIVGQALRESGMRINLDTNDGTSVQIYTDEPLGLDTLITNIKDRFGGLIYPLSVNSTGVTYRIFHEEPILTPFGTREGFSADATRIG